MIDQNWIVTSATCCKRDEIVTIKFNDYSIFFPDDDEHQIISTLFYIHQDLDVCLIRTAADMSEIVDKIPCLTKVCAVVRNLNIRVLEHMTKRHLIILTISYSSLYGMSFRNPIIS